MSSSKQLNQIFKDTERRAASLRQLGFLCIRGHWEYYYS